MALTRTEKKTRLSHWLGTFVALGALFVAAAATAEANRVPPRPEPPMPPPPAVEREPAPRTYVFDGLDSYPDHTFVLSHRRTFPRSERVDYEAQVIKQGESVELHYTSENPRRVQSVVVRVHAVQQDLPRCEDGEVELCHDWLTENSQATLDATGQFPATAMYMNRDIRAETLTYRPVIDQARDDTFSLRIYRSRAERYDAEGNVIFARDYSDPERPLHEQRRADEKHGDTSAKHQENTFLPSQAGALLLISGLAALMLVGVLRLRRFTT